MKTQQDRLMRLVVDLAAADYKQHPIWQFVREDAETGDWLVTPVRKLPVTDLLNRIVGLPVKLANGREVWGCMQNIYLTNPDETKELLSLSVEVGGKWVHLSRYFERYYMTRIGPEDLAKALGLGVDQVFPITYDLRPYAVGDQEVLVGSIQKGAPKKQ